MDSLHSNPTHPGWTPTHSIPFDGFNFPAPPSETLQPARETAKLRELEVKDLVQPLAGLGLNPRQIRELRRPKYRRALQYLDRVHEDDIDKACTEIYFERSKGSVPDTVSARHASGVPSLMSDRGSVATNFSLPLFGSSAYGPGHDLNLSHEMAPWQGFPEATQVDTTHTFHDSTTSFLALNEYDHYYNMNPQGLHAVKAPLQPQFGDIVSPLSLNVSANTPQATVGDRNHTKLDPVNNSLLISNQDRPRIQPPKLKFPCPELGCPHKHFSKSSELAKHLLGDHDKNVTFTCLHCQFETNREEMSKRHHSTQHHRHCSEYPQCVQEARERVRKYWGCGLCTNLFTDAKQYSAHYAEHFQISRAQQSEISFSTVIRSLLLQDATRDRWDARISAVGYLRTRYDLCWTEADCSDIRDALEYGIFDGASLSEASVADRLFDKLERRGTAYLKRPASSSPTH